MFGRKQDSIANGALAGLVLPIFGMSIFFALVSHRFESLTQCILYFYHYQLLYKIVTLSLMPGVGLFFIWSHFNKLNNARGLLMVTLLYGILVMILFIN